MLPWSGMQDWADLSDSKDVLAVREVNRLMSSRSLLHALSTIERALHQNSYHAAHRMYRAVPGAELHVADMAVGASADASLGTSAGAVSPCPGVSLSSSSVVVGCVSS